MKKTLLLGLVLGLCFPALVFGQNFPSSLIPASLPPCPSTSSDSEGGSFLSSIPLLKGVKLGKILVNPTAQVGYQRIGANMSIPVAADIGNPPAQLQIGTLDVTLNDFNFWSGTLGLNVINGPITFFGSVGGFSPHLFNLSGELPISVGPFGGAPQFAMTGSNFQFWVTQSGVAFEFKKGYSILGGFMWNQMEVRFGDTRTASGPSANQTLYADVLLNVGAPFFGIQVSQQGSFMASVIYSPFAWSQGNMDFRSYQTVVSDLHYTMNQPGTFLAATGQYYFPVPLPALCSMWFNGSLVNLKGDSDLEFTTAGPSTFRAKNVTISNTQYVIGGGLTLGVVF
jgi:hypothetical protein